MAVTSAAGVPVVTAREAAALAAGIDGVVAVPGDDAYAGECATYNLALARRPAVVVGAASAEDVSRAVRFAAERDLPVGVLATGHGPSVPADGAVLVTTRRMNAVTVDPATRVARAEAGARWQQVIDAAAPHRLAAAGGSSPQVGVVGYTLGGGLSPVLGRSHGWAADHVRAIELVTADGRQVRATAAREPDLFWAARGGKDNFGVATAIEFDLFELDSLYGGGLYFDGALAGDILSFYREWAPALPPELTVSVALLSLPPLPIVPEPLRGRLTVHVRVAYLGPAAEGARLVAPVRALGTPVLDTVGELPYEQAGLIHADPPTPLPIHEGSMRLTGLPQAAVDAIVRHAGPRSGSPLALVELRPLDGALARPAAVPNAVTCRDAAYQLFCAGIGSPEAEAAGYGRMDEIFRDLKPWQTSGAILNYLGPRDTDPASVREAFGPDTHDRLRRVKQHYDPGNRFRLNHNIAPATGEGQAS
jgi:FAD/FMN-containing dehydrogenase